MLDTDVEMFGKLRIDQTKFPFEYLEPDIFERKLDRALRGHFGSILQSAPQMYSLAHWASSLVALCTMVVTDPKRRASEQSN